MAVPILSDTKVRQAKPKEKDYKLTDGDGLYLLVRRNGAKCWRYDYRFAGKRKTLSCGTYPIVTLKAARELVADAKFQLVRNIDPSQEKQSVADAAGYTVSIGSRQQYRSPPSPNAGNTIPMHGAHGWYLAGVD